MIYVQRNDDNKIVGVFTSRQEGYAEERLPENDPEVVEFYARAEQPEVTL